MKYRCVWACRAPGVGGAAQIDRLIDGAASGARLLRGFLKGAGMQERAHGLMSQDGCRVRRALRMKALLLVIVVIASILPVNSLRGYCESGECISCFLIHFLVNRFLQKSGSVKASLHSSSVVNYL